MMVKDGWTFSWSARICEGEWCASWCFMIRVQGRRVERVSRSSCSLLRSRHNSNGRCWSACPGWMADRYTCDNPPKRAVSCVKRHERKSDMTQQLIGCSWLSGCFFSNNWYNRQIEWNNIFWHASSNLRRVPPTIQYYLPLLITVFKTNHRPSSTIIKNQ